MASSVPSTSGLQRAFYTLGTLTLITAVLYFAQVVLVPLALAVLLAFVLTMPASWLEQHGLHRVVSVLIAAALGFTILGAVFSVAALEIRSLPTTINDPQYKDNVKRIMEPLRGLIKQIEELEKAGLHMGDTAPPPGKHDEVIPVIVQGDKQGPSVLSWLPSLARPMLDLAAQTFLVVVLTIFIMIQRENLRDRLIRLVGKRHLPGTTRALDDAAHRVSRYLLLQTGTNAMVGFGVTAGLFLIGVPYALLWGMLATALRFVPYVGIWVAAALPFALSLVMFGWLSALLVLAVFLALELVIANLVEPLLFGHGTGVAPMMLLVVAAFWAWLWGPLGLLLSTPLTVCLVVIGKYVPPLRFFDVLLGNAPPLGPSDRYYQRLLAGDQDEATELVQEQMTNRPPEEVYDQVLLPALVRARADRAREEVNAEEERQVVRTTRELLEDVLAHMGPVGPTKAGAAAGNGAAARPAVRVLGCPAGGREDELALRMLGQLLQPMGAELEIVPPRRLEAKVRSAADGPVVVCIAVLPPGRLSHAVALCRRVRSAAHDAKILVGRWGDREEVEKLRAQLLKAGADDVGVSLLQTRRQILPPEEAQRAVAAAAGQLARG